jgi:hypothetical protein
MSKTCRGVNNGIGDTPRWSCVDVVVVWRESQVEVRWKISSSVDKEWPRGRGDRRRV